MEVLVYIKHLLIWPRNLGDMHTITFYGSASLKLSPLRPTYGMGYIRLIHRAAYPYQDDIIYLSDCSIWFQLFKIPLAHIDHLCSDNWPNLCHALMTSHFTIPLSTLSRHLEPAGDTKQLLITLWDVINDKSRVVWARDRVKSRVVWARTRLMWPFMRSLVT